DAGAVRADRAARRRGQARPWRRPDGWHAAVVGRRAADAGRRRRRQSPQRSGPDRRLPGRRLAAGSGLRRAGSVDDERAARGAMTDLTIGDLSGLSRGLAARQVADEATDVATHTRALQAQADDVGIAALQVVARGGDPLRETTGIGAAADWQPRLAYVLNETYRRTRELDEVLQAGGYGDIQQWFKGVADRYRDHNEGLLVKK